MPYEPLGTCDATFAVVSLEGTCAVEGTASATYASRYLR